MPMRPLRPCAQPGCPAIVAKGRCATHTKAKQRAADVIRGTAQERGYDSRWATFSTLWRRSHPLCGMRADGQLHAEHSRCVKVNLLNDKDLVTDHIIPLAKGGEQYDESNLQTLCRACNTRKDTGWGGKHG